jgi:hypothetical protein
MDAETIHLLQSRAKQLEAALALEHARSEKQSEAFVEVARACENRASDLQAQYAEKLAKLELSHDAVVAAHAATIAKLEAAHAGALAKLEASHASAIADQKAAMEALQVSHVVAVAAKDAIIAKLEAECGAVKAATALQLSAIHAAVTARLALEICPVRRDRRQFATLHAGPVPLDVFDREWCKAVCGKKWKADLDENTGMRVHVTQKGPGHLPLRGATPLPRHAPHSIATSAAAASSPLPSFCVIIEAYNNPQEGAATPQRCEIGFLPSHTSAGDPVAVTPTRGFSITNYGGWLICVSPSSGLRLNAGPVTNGWTPLQPRAGAAADVAPADLSTYATTAVVPKVPAGGAVEFSVDYAAGTCRVAFYTPTAVAGGFAEAPQAKMELRFVETQAGPLPHYGDVPARSNPTASDSRVRLYPVVSTAHAGAIWRFAA